MMQKARYFSGEVTAAETRDETSPRPRHRTLWVLLLLWFPWAAGMAFGAKAQGPLAVAALTWSVLLSCNALLNGRWWLWLLPAMVPPPLLAVVPAVLLLAELASSSYGLVALEFSALLASLAACGLNPRALRRGRAQSGESGLDVVVWNTEHWNQDRPDRSAMYEFLSGLGADVYLLQEYCEWTDDGIRDIDDEDRLDEVFTGYHRVIKGQLITLSKFPVVGVPELPARDLLRVDLQLDADTVLSTYNVHIPVPLLLINPLSRQFYYEIRRRRADRELHFRVLLQDLRRNPGPSVVSGDLNATPVMADSALLKTLMTDAIRVNGDLFPVSWHARTRWLRLWRVDWTFISPQVRVLRYEFIDPEGTSDHRAQRIRLDVPG